jgi:hypothetical protein
MPEGSSLCGFSSYQPDLRFRKAAEDLQVYPVDRIHIHRRFGDKIDESGLADEAPRCYQPGDGFSLQPFRGRPDFPEDLYALGDFFAAVIPPEPDGLGDLVHGAALIFSMGLEAKRLLGIQTIRFSRVRRREVRSPISVTNPS